MSNSSLFKLETTVALKTELGNSLQYVRINTDNVTREKIWRLLNDRSLNPHVARYSGGEPTIIELRPYEGYDITLIQDMAYTFTSLVKVESWTSLLTEWVYDLVGLKPTGFEPNKEKVQALQRLYVVKMAANSLQRELDKAAGLNTYAITDWYNEAVQAFRRADNQRQISLADLLNELKGYRNQALEMRKVKEDKKQALQEQIDSFRNIFQDSYSSEILYKMYEEIMDDIDEEHERLTKEVADFKSFDRIQFEIMDQIRRATPPPLPDLKK